MSSTTSPWWRYALDSLDLNLGWYLDYAYCTLYTLTHSSECNTIDLQVRICRFSSCGRTTVRLPVTTLTHHGCSQHSTMPCQSTTRGLKWSTIPEKRTYEIMVVQASWPSNRYYLIANKQEYRIHILQHVYNMYDLYIYTIIYIYTSYLVMLQHTFGEAGPCQDILRYVLGIWFHPYGHLIW